MHIKTRHPRAFQTWPWLCRAREIRHQLFRDCDRAGTKRPFPDQPYKRKRNQWTVHGKRFPGAHLTPPNIALTWTVRRNLTRTVSCARDRAYTWHCHVNVNFRAVFVSRNFKRPTILDRWVCWCLSRECKCDLLPLEIVRFGSVEMGGKKPLSGTCRWSFSSAGKSTYYK